MVYTMKKFSMTCSCGDVMNMEAANRKAAVGKFKAMMTADMVAKHMAEKHPGKPVMAVAAVHAMIDQSVKEA